jgi:hypothetical protein
MDGSMFSENRTPELMINMYKTPTHQVLFQKRGMMDVRSTLTGAFGP